MKYIVNTYSSVLGLILTSLILLHFQIPDEDTMVGMFGYGILLIYLAIFIVTFQIVYFFVSTEKYSIGKFINYKYFIYTSLIFFTIFIIQQVLNYIF